jgi:hypothetical protein
VSVRAREWTVAAAFSSPAEHGIPELPAWQVRRLDCGGVAFVADGEPFIAAERPCAVRR